MQLIEKFEEHCRYATKKRIDGLSESARHFYGLYITQYMYAYDEYNLQTISKFLAEKELSYSTKAVLARGVGKFLYWSNLITKEEFAILKERFRMPEIRWSEKQITKENVEDAIRLADIVASAPLAMCRNTFILMLFSCLGARVSQLIDLNMEDVVLEDRYLVVSLQRKKEVRSDLKKNIDIKRIPRWYNIAGRIIEHAYMEYVWEREKYDVRDRAQPFFINSSGQRITSDYVQKFVRDIGKRLGIKLTPHYFRHYVGSKVAEKHGILKASILLGHSSLATTQRYINPEGEKYDISNILED